MTVVDSQTWTWNEQDCGEQMDNEEDSPRDIEIAENPLNPSVEQNKWEELLRLRYEDYEEYEA